MRRGWTETILGEVATLSMGRTPSRSDKSYWTEDLTYPFCTIADMDGMYIFPKREGVSFKAIQDGKAKIASTGTLLMSFKLTIGRMGFAGQDIYPNEAIVSITPNSASAIDVFLYYLLGFQDLTADSGRAVKGETLNSKSLSAIPISLPPVVEQKRIVDVVSSVDAYIDALQQQADTARTARNAVLHELLTAGGDDWTETTLGKTLEIARGGSPRPIRDYITSEEDGVNWVKIGDASASSKYIYQTEQKIRPEGILRSRPVKVGDFILSNSMSFGRPYIMRTDGCIHDGWLLFSKVEKHFDEDFLYNLLMSDLVQKQFDSLAAGSGVRNLNIEIAKEVVISLPPLKVQREIAEVANGLDEFILSVKQAVEEARNLRFGLLSDLLSGEHEIPESYDRLLGAA